MAQMFWVNIYIYVEAWKEFEIFRVFVMVPVLCAVATNILPVLVLKSYDCIWDD
jgi:hypothetical protein